MSEARPASARRPRSVTTALVLGLVVTVLLTVLAGGAAAERSQERFALHVDDARRRVQQRLDSLTDVSLALRATLMTAGPTRDSFDRLYAVAADDRLFDGVHAVSFNRLVAAADTTAFEADVREELAALGEDPTSFTVRPATTPFEDRFVVQYIRPLAENRAALGFDIGSDPERRAAVERARDLGEPASTGPLSLVQDDGSAVPAVLVATPVYGDDTVPATAPARRRHFTGVLVLVVRVEELVRSVIGSDPGFDAAVYDVGEITGDAARPIDEGVVLVGPAQPPELLAAATTFDLNVGGRRWRLAATPSGSWVDDAWQVPLLVALLGLVVTAAVTWALGASARTAVRLERDVARRTAELDALLTHAPDTTLVVGPDGLIERASREVASLLGHEPSAIVGRAVEELLPAGDRARHVTLRAGLSDTGTAHAMAMQREVLALHRDGHAVPVEVSLATLDPDPETGEVRVIASVRDVTARREAQRQLRELNEQKTAFMRTVSHELRTPLTAIVGFVAVLRQRRAQLDDGAVDEILARLARNAAGLDDLIQEIIGFARLDEVVREHTPVPFDLDAHAAEVVGQLSPVVASHELDLVLPGTPVPVHADPAAVTRVLSNLLVNAVRYSPDGTTITVRVEPGEDEGPAVVVADEGPGIPVAERERVFERFWRGTSAQQTAVAGTGIGLAVVAELVARDGGQVEVADAPSGGALLRVTLPAPTGPTAPRG